MSTTPIDVRDYRAIYQQTVDLHEEWGRSNLANTEAMSQLWRQLGRILAGGVK